MGILIVDDEQFTLKLIAHQLANLGYGDVIACERVDDAIAMLVDGHSDISLILCDLQMPEKDGIEFVRYLGRTRYPGRLALLSGEDERTLQAAEKLAKGHQLDIVGVLHKPVTPEQLRQVLNGNVRGTAQSSRGTGVSYAVEDLRRAITAGELVNYYQPQVAFASSAVTGVETLVRWQHPVDGLVGPDQFITLAEENGLIGGLTRTVVSAALRQVCLWQDAGLDLQVAINVSMDDLADLDFADFITHEIDTFGIAPQRVVLEITESRVMSDPLTALDSLTRLRLKHIVLSIDDFGTGYSSLAQLRDLPFDELKIDRGFIHQSSRNKSLTAIVAANLNMARQLGMRTVAEGVQDQADWDFLQASGCDTAQGYFIAPPMPARALPDWVANWEARGRRLAEPTP